MTTDFRALCAELTDELADFQWAVIEAGVGWACPDTEALIDRARAALARWGHQPAPPAEGEQRHPAPVPVSERLPGPEDCDGEGRCWWWDRYEGCWWYLKPISSEQALQSWSWTHWLPAHALPLPEVNND